MLVPYFILTTAVYVPKVMLSSFAAREIDPSFMGYVNALVYPDTNPIILLWFLPALWMVYLIGYPLRAITQKRTGVHLLIAALFVGADCLWGNLRFMGLGSVMRYMPFFLLGMICRDHYQTVINNKFLKSPATFIGLMIAFTLCFVYLPLPLMMPILGILMSISFVMCCEKFGMGLFPMLRKYIFTIYLLQWFPMVATRIALKMMGWDGLPAYALMFLSGIVVPYVVGRLVDQLPEKGVFKVVRLTIGL